jgi:hypothetical protein
MDLAGTVRRHERALIVAWLASCAVLLGIIGVWGVGMGGAERAIDLWNERWVPRIERGEELMAAGRFEQAAIHFERLDEDFPAIFVKHRLDRERERLLERLGTCYIELDKKRRALETFENLVGFDPRNWRNHYLRATALAHFGEDPDEVYADVLAIHPNHRPSVEARVTARFEGGRYAEVPALYQAYLDGWLLARLTLDLGATSIPLEVVVDGREHVVEAPVDLAAGWSGELCLRTAGYSVRLASIELIEPLRVGSVERPATTRVDDFADWRPHDVTPAGPATWSAASPDSSLCLADVEHHATTRVRVVLAVYKAVSPELWSMVEKSHLNNLDHDGLEAARARTVVGG